LEQELCLSSYFVLNAKLKSISLIILKSSK